MFNYRTNATEVVTPEWRERIGEFEGRTF